MTACWVSLIILGISSVRNVLTGPLPKADGKNPTCWREHMQCSLIILVSAMITHHGAITDTIFYSLLGGLRRVTLRCIAVIRSMHHGQSLADLSRSIHIWLMAGILPLPSLADIFQKSFYPGFLVGFYCIIDICKPSLALQPQKSSVSDFALSCMHVVHH